MAWDGTGLLIVAEQADILGGQERVLESLLGRYPAADAMALSFSVVPGGGRPPAEGGCLRKLRVPGRRRPLMLPLHAGRIALAAPGREEVVLSLTQAGSSAAARTGGGARHVAYSSGLPTFYRHSELSIAEERPLLRPLLRAALPGLRACHGRLMRRPDRLIANSRFSAGQLQEAYDLRAEVLHPPVRTGFFRPGKRERRHWLAVGRITTQKRFDALVAAFDGIDDELVVAGVGAALERVRAVAPPNVSFVGFARDDELRELYRSARGLICPSVETFGLVMAEALACGTPVIAPRAGGAPELLREGTNGVFLEGLGAEAVGRAIGELERMSLDPEACRAAVESCAEDRFLTRMDAVLDAERALARGGR